MAKIKDIHGYILYFQFIVIIILYFLLTVLINQLYS